jgi:V/A-type H+-transporting ATPase subunit E
MEMQLNSLIEKIKQDGIKQASQKSEEIIKQAEEGKKDIIRQAKEQAERIMKQAEAQAAKLKDNSHKAVTQAVRDAGLSLKQEIKKLFDNILKKEIQRTFSDDFIRELIIRIVETLPKGREAGIEISLSQQEKTRLEDLILSGLKKESAHGITFKVNPNIDKGFYIGIKDEGFHYDFTDQAILEILKEYLRPFIVKIIEEEDNG